MDYNESLTINSAMALSENLKKKENIEEMEQLKNQNINNISLDAKKINVMLANHIENNRQSSKKQKIYNWFTAAIALASLIIAIIGLCK